VRLEGFPPNIVSLSMKRRQRGSDGARRLRNVVRELVGGSSPCEVSKHENITTVAVEMAVLWTVQAVRRQVYSA
jgi:hypothetical protein